MWSKGPVVSCETEQTAVTVGAQKTQSVPGYETAGLAKAFRFLPAKVVKNIYVVKNERGNLKHFCNGRRCSTVIEHLCTGPSFSPHHGKTKRYFTLMKMTKLGYNLLLKGTKHFLKEYEVVTACTCHPRVHCHDKSNGSQSWKDILRLFQQQRKAVFV